MKTNTKEKQPSEILTSPILAGITEEEYREMQSLHCVKIQHYIKGTPVFLSGDITQELGIVLRGQITIENIDLWGNRSILSSVPTGSAFAETYAISGQPLMVDAIASEESDILLLKAALLLSPGYASESWQPKLIRNLLRLSTQKNLNLSNRIFCTAPKKIRSRLLMYLSNCAIQKGSSEFDIPFDRQELADYLNLDRSALSKELGKMKTEGLLDFRKNHFILYQV